MKICADRLDHFQTGIFAYLDEIKERLISEGQKIYNFSIGTPDFKPPEHVMEAVAKAAMAPENFKYAIRDIPKLLEAVQEYYNKRFEVRVATDEIMSVHGTQEGIGHLGLSLCNPGDVVLLPDPGYPIFEAGTYFGQADIYFYPLTEENNFLPDFKSIPEDIFRRTKYIIVSYPSNPVGRTAPVSMYEELIDYAEKYDFIVINDNAYSDIIFDGSKGFSFLSLPGAKDVGIEFFSLSKSFNVTGARISFAIGNKKVLEALELMRSQLDFGMFLPVQYGAIAALKGPKDHIEKQRLEYMARRDALCGGLRRIGWNVPDSQGTMFVWAHLPDGYSDSLKFCMELVEKTGVLCTPGSSFGTMGQGYVRFALVHPVEVIDEVVDIIAKSGMLH